MSGDARVKSLIDRILRLKEERGTDVALGHSIEDRVARLRYTLEPLATINSRSLASARAEVAAGRLLGVQNDTVRHRVAMVRRHGSLDAALKKLAWVPGVTWDVPTLNGDLLGLVYVMAATDYPGVIKVGFSRSPKTRRVALERQYRIKLDLLASAPGTEFDEHMLQHELAIFGLAGEWFDFSRRWEGVIPAIRFYTPERMWTEMREAA